MGQAPVISTMAVYNGHSVVELTMCSNETQTAFEVGVQSFSGNSTTRSHIEYFKNTASPWSKGNYVYFSDQSETDFAVFFGFTPTYFQNGSFLFNGTENFGTLGGPVDVYGIVGVDHTGGPADFSKGWVGRKPNRPPGSHVEQSSQQRAIEGSYPVWCVHLYRSNHVSVDVDASTHVEADIGQASQAASSTALSGKAEPEPPSKLSYVVYCECTATLLNHGFWYRMMPVNRTLDGVCT